MTTTTTQTCTVVFSGCGCTVALLVGDEFPMRCTKHHPSPVIVEGPSYRVAITNPLVGAVGVETQIGDGSVQRRFVAAGEEFNYLYVPRMQLLPG